MLVARLIRESGPYADRELALLLGAVAVLFLLAGSGRFGLDAWIERRRRRSPVGAR